MRLAWTLVFAGLLVGCGGGMSGGEDAGGELPDGFIQTGCKTKSDCDDGDPCTVDSCTSALMCKHTPVNCSTMSDECNQGTCDPDTGECKAEPSNESMQCTTMNGDPGACMTGTCTPVPQCDVDSFNGLSCADKSTNGTTVGNSILDTYTCATGETGPETAYPFSVTTDRMVTVSLSGTGTNDFDLIILEGTACIAAAPCAAQAVTPNKGDESVTFMAKGGTDYLIVVEGRGGAKGSFTLNITCVGGVCKPLKTLACNMSVMGDTSSTNATSVLSNYDCGMAPGPEETYTLTQSDTTNYRLKLSGAGGAALTQDLDLYVVFESSGECDPTFCKANAAMKGLMNEEVSFQGFSGSTYEVVVDSKMTGAPYLLEVNCPPSCYKSGNSISCSNLGDARRNDDAGKSTNAISSWACDMNTTGPEVVYRFSPDKTGMYQIDLDGLSADLDLIVVEGGFSDCDPTAMCVAKSINAGTTAEQVVYNFDSAKDYYIAVDGKAGAVSSYNIRLKPLAAGLCPPPSCTDNGANLDCSYLEDARKNDDGDKSQNAIDAWACDADTTGPEVIYAFRAPASGMYTVTLDQLTADLDLIVMTGTSFTCDSTKTCTASSVKAGTASESVTFAATANTYYYVAVDGKNKAVGSYHISLTSASCPAPTCSNGFDSLSCSFGKTTSNRNDASGATSAIKSWTCTDGSVMNTNAPEFAHYFSPPMAGSYTVKLRDMMADLDLFVVETSSSSSCMPASCIKHSSTAGTADESVTFTAAAGKSYFLVVDGKNAAVSDYTLTLSSGCP